MVSSTNGGATFASVLDADTGFILANLSSEHPIAVYDEGCFLYDPPGPPTQEMDVRTAHDDAILEFAGAIRNIGPVAGNLWLDLIDADSPSGASVLDFLGPAVYVNVPSNADQTTSAPDEIKFIMDTTPIDPLLRINVVVGHYDTDGTTRIVDDVNRVELRRIP